MNRMDLHTSVGNTKSRALFHYNRMLVIMKTTGIWSCLILAQYYLVQVLFLLSLSLIPPCTGWSLLVLLWIAVGLWAAAAMTGFVVVVLEILADGLIRGSDFLPLLSLDIVVGAALFSVSPPFLDSRFLLTFGRYSSFGKAAAFWRFIEFEFLRIWCSEELFIVSSLTNRLPSSRGVHLDEVLNSRLLVTANCCCSCSFSFLSSSLIWNCTMIYQELEELRISWKSLYELLKSWESTGIYELIWCKKA